MPAGWKSAELSRTPEAKSPQAVHGAPSTPNMTNSRDLAPPHGVLEAHQMTHLRQSTSGTATAGLMRCAGNTPGN